ncbi:Inosine/uridine-preferring nucleoside hydrolase domain-containing protein [Endogone sp. FLAS-F59071]|nr:Inosine/uridine-preferring nucleoside hydrolase domain-containing protein [Endogone sp. FLAS-F59071]|eukprot:RUS23339.1 Inosine/uridine-preferring nucleoside hydrolase domain-containing protein [Endogone sp. FLAS-F59071]
MDEDKPIPDPIQIIIDTDPGIDDALAILLALASPEIDVRAITITHGNTTVRNATRNIVTLMSILEQQIQFSGEAGAADIHKFKASCPVIAVGEDTPMKSDQVFASYFHGVDGLGELHTTHPEFTPKDWESLIGAEQAIVEDEMADLRKRGMTIPPLKPRLFTTTSRSGIDEILHQLREAPPNTITIVALGPLTNLGLAIERDAVTFSRVKQVVILGGAVDVPGNTTPYAEFNFLADPHAAQIVLQSSHGFIPGEPGVTARAEAVAKGKVAPVHVTLLPLDAAEPCSSIPYSIYLTHLLPLTTPLSRFTSTIMAYAYDVCIRKFGIECFGVYDALAVSLTIDLPKFVLAKDHNSAAGAGWSTRFMDIRVETEGTLTRGMCCQDRRNVLKPIWFGINHNVEVVVAGEHQRFLTRFLARVFDVVLEQ